MRRRERLRSLAALALLALVVAIFFWPLLLVGNWIPRGGGDLVSFIWPMLRFAARSLRSGEIPLWNPYLYSGAPFVADNQSGVFYPVNLLVFALFGEPSYGVVEGLVLFHIWLAGANMFALARGLGLHRAAALLGAIAFAFSDLFVTHIGNLNLNATIAWLPLFLLLTHRAMVRQSPGWAAAAGAVLAVAALAGHGQMLLFFALLLAFYLLYRLAIDSRGGRGSRWRTLGLAALIGAVGMGGAALALLPAYELAGHTGRSHLSYAEATRFSLPPRALIGLLAPGFYGRGEADFWGPWERVEVGYVGVATLVLAAMGVARGRIRKRSPGSGGDNSFLFGFFVLVVPVALLLAMGRYTPLYRLLYRGVPVFDRVRVPARLVVLADFGLAALAAYGLDGVLKRAGDRRFVWTGVGAMVAAAICLAVGLPQARSIPPPDRVSQAAASVIVAAVFLGLSGLLLVGSRRLRWVVWLLVPLVVLDLVGLGYALEVEPNDPTLGFRHEDIVAFLREDPALFRIEGAARAWQPDAALLHGLYDIGGVFNPLALAPYDAYRWALGNRGTPLYSLTGAKYVLADKGNPPGGEHLVPVHTGSPDIDVYLNTKALPRAVLVHKSRVVPDHAAAWQAIHEATFDPSREVVLERGEPLSADPDGGEPTISFIRYGINEVEVEIRTPASGYLVLTDVYYPGWRATIDGAPAEILRADYVFRAVLLPPGRHVVRMVFAPVTYCVGLVTTLVVWAGLMTWAAAALLGRCRGRRRGKESRPRRA